MTTKTELLNNGVVVATKTAAPFYSWDWTPATSGASSLTYKRYEDNVLVFTSAAITGTVDVAAAGIEYVVWEQFRNASSSGNGQLIYTSGTGSYTNGAYGTKAINGDNAVSFIGRITNTISSGEGIGLTNTYGGISAEGFGGLDIFALVGQAGDNYQIFEDGVKVLDATPYATNDVLTIRVAGTTVTVELNGTTVYTSAKTYTLPLTPIGLLDDITNCEILESNFESNTNLITSPL